MSARRSSQDTLLSDRKDGNFCIADFGEDFFGREAIPIIPGE